MKTITYGNNFVTTAPQESEEYQRRGRLLNDVRLYHLAARRREQAKSGSDTWELYWRAGESLEYMAQLRLGLLGGMAGAW